MTVATDDDILAGLDLHPAPPQAAPVDASLQLDVTMVLLDCHRDRRGDGVFREDVSPDHLQRFAALVAQRLAPRIGGRYVPRRTERDRIAERDAAVVAAYNGLNRRQVMRDFGISRRLFYAILARAPRPPR